jgi:hypothetical protein
MVLSPRDPYSRADTLHVVDVIGDPHRNRVLRLLREHGTPMPLDTLAEHVDAGSDDSAVGRRVTGPRHAAAQLHHTHLPKLDDAGLIGYDQDAQVVVWFDEDRLGSLLETGHRVLESLQEERPRDE